MAGNNRTRWGKLGCMLGGRRVESERSNGVLRVRDAETLAGKPQPCVDTQINRNVLN